MLFRSKDYVKDENGKFVLRKKDDFEKQIRTDEGMMLYERIKNGKITAEEMKNIKQAITEWEGMDDKEKTNSFASSQMSDIIYITNNFDNTTVTSTPSEVSTGNESNIPQ